jgi:hypothetical protein
MLAEDTTCPVASNPSYRGAQEGNGRIAPGTGLAGQWASLLRGAAGY